MKLTQPLASEAAGRRTRANGGRGWAGRSGGAGINGTSCGAAAGLRDAVSKPQPGQPGAETDAAAGTAGAVVAGAWLVAGVLAGAGVWPGVVCVWLADGLGDPEGLAVREGLSVREGLTFREGLGDVGGLGTGEYVLVGAVFAGAGFTDGGAVPDTGRTRM